jgi:hypothetical protein
MKHTNYKGKKQTMKYELELNFDGSWTRFEIEAMHYEMLRPQLENWEALIFIRIREKGATVWSEISREELANS